ncbi:flagellar basal body P-ring protein FlgI [soil metagenome]
MTSHRPHARLAIALLGILLCGAPAAAQLAPDVRIRDLTVDDHAVPIRLMGYGLVVGLDNTGDRVTGSRQSGMTVASVVNLLRRFDIEVPNDIVHMRNVAAVLVTAEVSPYLKPGAKFDVSIASVGDARSLRGGVLWMTPLLADVGGKPMGSAQGAILTTSGASGATWRARYSAENAARIPTGGLLETDLPKVQFAVMSRLLLREPDIGLASRIAAAINKELGDKSASVEDPGAVTLALKPDDTQDRAALLTRIRDLRVRPERPSRLVIDARDGTIVAGGDLAVGDATVSHGGFTLSVGGAPDVADSTVKNAAAVPDTRGGMHVATGTLASAVADALHAMRAPASDIAAIFEALHAVGALSAEVVIR